MAHRISSSSYTCGYGGDGAPDQVELPLAVTAVTAHRISSRSYTCGHGGDGAPDQLELPLAREGPRGEYADADVGLPLVVYIVFGAVGPLVSLD